MHQLYPAGLEGILDRSVDMTADVRCCLLTTDYVFSAAHRFLADLGGKDNGRSPPLESKTFKGGEFDAADTRITATSPVPSGALVLYQHTGNDATARLIAHIAKTSKGMPFTPAKGQIVLITWPDAPGKIFKLEPA
jgi:hypothetical protein